MSETIEVRGNASAEELAAVLAILRPGGDRPAPPHGYARWRATRLAALRHRPDRGRA